MTLEAKAKATKAALNIEAMADFIDRVLNSL